MKKAFIGLFVVVFAFSITINAQEELSQYQTDIQKTIIPEQTNDIRANATANNQLTCTTLADGRQSCDDGEGYRYLKYKNGRFHSETYYTDHSTQTYYYNEDNSYLKKITFFSYNSNKIITFSQVAILIKNTCTRKSPDLNTKYGMAGIENFTHFYETWYSSDGEKLMYYIWNRNAKHIDYKMTFYRYHSNKKIAEKRIVLKNNANKVSKVDNRFYYKTSILQAKYLGYHTAKGAKKTSYYTTYRNDGTKKNHKKVTWAKNGYLSKAEEYVYNKKGKLKSNKDGSAYKYQYTFKNGDVKKVMKAKYNAKGKLGKYSKTKNRNINFPNIFY